MSELRKLESMTPDEFRKMMCDIGKGHRVEKYDKITRAAVHVDPPKIYGFLGWVNGEIKCEWEFETLLKSPKVCDWLDYYGFDRPKWRPSSFESESVEG